MRPVPLVHPTAQIHASVVLGDEVSIGARTRVWHFSHLMSGATVGQDCVLGQGCFVAATAAIGNRVKIQNNVSVYDGVVLDDDVFCGPSAVFTNVKNPRAAVSRRHEYLRTFVERGATIGANATILPGTVLGEYAFVGAGATVTKSVPAYALVVGAPARQIGWMSRHGERLSFDAWGRSVCPATGTSYHLVDGVVHPAPSAANAPP